jgi:hypothetical protein
MQLVGRRASAMIATPNRKSQKRMWMMLRVTISIFLIVTASVVSVMPILIIGDHFLNLSIYINKRVNISVNNYLIEFDGLSSTHREVALLFYHQQPITLPN